MAIRQVKDAIDLSTNEPIYFKGHAMATYMSDGSTVEDRIKLIDDTLANEDNSGSGVEIVESISDLDPNAPIGTMACVTDADNADVYVKKGEWSKLHEDELTEKANVVKYADATPLDCTLNPNTYNRVTLEKTASTLTCKIDTSEKSIFNELLLEVSCDRYVKSKINFVDEVTGEEVEMLWANGEEPEFTSNTLYVISIVGKCAVYAKFPKKANTLDYIYISNQEISFDESKFNAVLSHEWDEKTGVGVIKCSEESIYIGKSAFQYCSGLTSIVIPNGVVSIGDYAFYNCSGLTSVVIPDSVTSIGYYAFARSGLTSIVIPDSVTSIGDYAFTDCFDLTSMTIGNGVKYIGSMSFYGEENLTGVYITDLAAWCEIDFYDVYNNPLSYAENLYLNGELVTELVIPEGVTSIGNFAFVGCSSLTSIVIPDSVTSIGGCAFMGCVNLTNVTIGNGVTSIGYGAFYGCSSLTSVVIPDSVTSIGEYAFTDCSNLPVIDNIRYADTYLVEVVDNSLSTYTIKEGTRFIGDYAFKSCSNLTSIVIPDSVTSIGEYAFTDCSNLPVIDNIRYADTYLVEVVDDSLSTYTIKEGTRFIGDNAFNSYSNLTSIVIPDSVTSIGGWAFNNCSGLTNVTIGSGVTTIGSYAFDNCYNLTSINIPNSVTSIGDNAFCYCESLASVVIPDGVTSIGSSAFSGCSSLTSIVIPDSVTSIGNSAFDGCSSLTSIVIPDSVTYIGEGALCYCESLASVTIPENVVFIGNYLFADNYELHSVYLRPMSPPELGFGGDRLFDNLSSSDYTIYVPIYVEDIYKNAPGWNLYSSQIIGYEY